MRTLQDGATSQIDKTYELCYSSYVKGVPKVTELEGTFLNTGKGSDSLSELDALISETLSESKFKKETSSDIKEAHQFSATKMTIDTTVKEEEKAIEQPTEIKIIDQTAHIETPAPQKQEEKPKENKANDDPFKSFKVGNVIKGTVARVDGSGALIDINYKSDGFIVSSEFDGRILKSGEIIDVYIDALSTKEGYVALSLKKAQYEGFWTFLYDAFKTKNTFEVSVSSAVGGGLVVDFKGIRGFVPASQVSKSPDTPLSDFVGKTIAVKLIEIDRRHSKIIMSHRLGNAEKQRVDKDKLFENIEVGQILNGTVSSIKRFGIFVNVNGVEGLVHVNDIAWKRVEDPTKAATIGQKLDVFVIGVDKFAKKLSLGLKQLQPDPWESAGRKYKQGQQVTAKILRLAKFGAFAEIEEGIEGLIHISELSTKPIQMPSDAVKPGDVVKAIILRISTEEQRKGRSIREVEVNEEKNTLKEVQSNNSSPVKLGDTISEELREKISGNNEIPGQA